jgi:predicted nucleotidyltransferase
MTTLLKVLVGSRAHKLHTETSDYDYRGVFVVPTEDFLKIGIAKPQQTSWIEGDIDDTSWEIGKFLFLATKCNRQFWRYLKPQSLKQRNGEIDYRTYFRIFGIVQESKTDVSAMHIVKEKILRR